MIFKDEVRFNLCHNNSDNTPFHRQRGLCVQSERSRHQNFSPFTAYYFFFYQRRKLYFSSLETSNDGFAVIGEDGVIALTMEVE